MKKLKFSTVLTSLPLFLIGCSSTPTPTTIKAEYKYISTPKLGEISTAFLGDNVSETSYEIIEKGIEVSGNYNFMGNTLSAGSFAKIHENENYEFFQTTKSSTGVIKAGVYRLNEIRLTKGTNEFCPKQFGMYSGCWSDVNYKTVNLTTQNDKSLKQYFIYLGKTRNTLKFSYREFSGKMARPAFSTEVNYELTDKDRLVGYKKLKMEIIEATNTEIKYKIIRTFDGISKI